MKKSLLFIALGLLICVVSAYVGIRFISQDVPNEDVKNSKDIVKVNVPEQKEVEENKIIETNTVPVIEQKTAKFSLGYPVEGDLGLNYSPEALIYSKTLQEWTIHNGIDIKAKRGTPVKASENGIVESITETTDKGIEIIIAHENGYKTVYSNLSSKDMVSVGDKVNKGQVISGIGNTSSFEYYEPDHLHFEIIKDGKYINPVDVLER